MIRCLRGACCWALGAWLSVLPLPLAAQSLEPDSVTLHRGTFTVTVNLPRAGRFLVQLRDRVIGSPLLDRVAIVVDTLTPSPPPADTSSSSLVFWRRIDVPGFGHWEAPTPRLLVLGTYTALFSDSLGRPIATGTITLTRRPP